MKYLVILAILIIISCNNSCVELVDHVYSISVKNNMNRPFNFLVSYQYPDTLIPDNYNDIKSLYPNGETRYDRKEKWENIFNELPADTLSIYFIDRDTLKNFEWDIIRRDYMISKRYDLSLQDLERLNYTISYPPSVEMEGIKMYPK